MIFSNRYFIAEFFSEFITPSTSSNTNKILLLFFLFYDQFFVNTYVLQISKTFFNNFLPFLSQDAFITNN